MHPNHRTKGILACHFKFVDYCHAWVHPVFIVPVISISLVFLVLVVGVGRLFSYVAAAPLIVVVCIIIIAVVGVVGVLLPLRGSRNRLDVRAPHIAIVIVVVVFGVVHYEFGVSHEEFYGILCLFILVFILRPIVGFLHQVLFALFLHLHHFLLVVSQQFDPLLQ